MTTLSGYSGGMAQSSPPPPGNAVASRLRLALNRELGADEAVVWHGWQLGRIERRLFAAYLFAVPWTLFSLAWTGVAFIAVASSDGGGAGPFAWAFPMFGVPFIAVGVWMLSRPFVPLLQKGRVLYVVTTRRALKLHMGQALAIDSVPADRIGRARRREHRDGSGTIELAVRIGRDSDGDVQTEHFVIGLVDDVIGAQRAIDALARPAPSPAAGPAFSS